MALLVPLVMTTTMLTMTTMRMRMRMWLLLSAMKGTVEEQSRERSET
jgi:hypothetical protein